MSGYTPEESTRQAMQQSGTAFLQKPFNPEELKVKLRTILRN